MAIQSFGNQETKRFYIENDIPKGVEWAQVAGIALRKLDMLNYAHTLLDLRSPPGNRLEALKGNLKGFYSVRINNQWRVIFVWKSSGPEEVQIVDYHK